eukprot:Skav230499  [mRNA]  locus=scaffold2083:3845:10908:+ [translate_table: standard]
MDSQNKRRRVVVDVANLPAQAKMKLHVSLPSGRSASVEPPLNGTVGDLKMAAQQSLGQRFLRLMGPDGTLLSPVDSLQHARLQDGDGISAVVQQPKLAATNGAFALWCVGSDRVVTWGNPRAGGDSSRAMGFGDSGCDPAVSLQPRVRFSGGSGAACYGLSYSSYSYGALSVSGGVQQVELSVKAGLETVQVYVTCEARLSEAGKGAGVEVNGDG